MNTHDDDVVVVDGKLELVLVSIAVAVAAVALELVFVCSYVCRIGHLCACVRRFVRRVYALYVARRSIIDS